MSEVSFNLKPFPNCELIPPIQIGTQVQRESNLLRISWEITGDLTQIHLADLKERTFRQSELWQTTCLEFFLGIKDDPGYWEFNLAPSGDWNIYQFTGYRQGMQEEKAIASLPFAVSRSSTCWRLDLDCDLSWAIDPVRELDLAITAVIESKTGEISYWALTHCGAQPDFHQRDSFQITI